VKKYTKKSTKWQNRKTIKDIVLDIKTSVIKPKVIIWILSKMVGKKFIKIL